MRYSEHELHRMACAASTDSTMQGKLFYKGVQQGKLRPVRELQGQAFREREFRLQGNFLFYYKTNEDRRGPEPLGALLLERCTVQREMNAEKGFVFSIAFQDSERKHLFVASSSQLCDQWVTAIRSASYEQLKATWIMLRSKIKRLVDMQSQATNSEQQSQQRAAAQAKVPPRPCPPRPPPPSSQPTQSSIQPRRNAPPPPKSASTPQEPAEALLLDFS